MNTIAIQEVDTYVAMALWSRLRGFRATHPTTCGTIEGIEEYVACGHGEKALLILLGLLGLDETPRSQSWTSMSR
jgi:hypothetical protein